MDEEVFEELCARITPHIQKRDTVMRPAIRPRLRLASTLRYSASGNSFKDLSLAVRIPHNTLSIIVEETLIAIASELQNECIKCPSSVEEWQEVEEGFRVLWNFPHCVGALDGKHINFRPPRQGGSSFRNYKGRDSIILMALVDARYNFLYLDIGTNGRRHDGAVFRDSELGRRLSQGLLNFSDACPLPKDVGGPAMPYVITADDAFSLSTHLMKPYPSRGLTYVERVFNYRLSRARRIVENVFGMLAKRFRVMLTTIPLSVNKVELITLVCCILHNFILARKPAQLNNNVGENAGENKFPCNLAPVRPQGGNNPTRSAKTVRDRFREYFCGVGAVPWQQGLVLREIIKTLVLKVPSS